MDMNINRLRELIRTGEYLKDNYNDETVLTQWIFNVSFFTDTLDSSMKRMINSQIHSLQTMPPDFLGNRDRQKKVLGFLISLYNNCSNMNLHTAHDSQSVFIVHGHDDALIESVKECVAKTGLNPIVLREQPNHDMTIIEKLEDWLGNCKCAIILYTPCDIGRAVLETTDEARARQNVVYEHGLFQGYLGRHRTIILKKGATTLPGDYDGMVYISTDSPAWEEDLIKNIQAIDK
jgi:predicted nucleotide-binding protein